MLGILVLFISHSYMHSYSSTSFSVGLIVVEMNSYRIAHYPMYKQK